MTVFLETSLLKEHNYRLVFIRRIKQVWFEGCCGNNEESRSRDRFVEKCTFLHIKRHRRCAYPGGGISPWDACNKPGNSLPSHIPRRIDGRTGESKLLAFSYGIWEKITSCGFVPSGRATQSTLFTRHITEKYIYFLQGKLTLLPKVRFCKIL